MRIASFMAAGAFLLAHQASCVRVELDKAEDKAEEVAPQALRVTATDSVVLCPLSAAIGPSGNVSIVWAGYPPADDRLQLLHALVSTDGVSAGAVLLQAPRSIAFLASELAALEIQRSETGFEVQAVEDSASAILSIALDESGAVLGASRLPVRASSRVADACESSLFGADAKLRVFRGQVDGELPLFVQSTPF